MVNPVEAIARRLHLRPWFITTVLIVLTLLTLGLGKCAYDAAVIDRHVTQANNTMLGRTITANETAATAQRADDKALTDLQRSYDNALNNPPPGNAASARVRHACQQLRNDGYREADLPPGC